MKYLHTMIRVSDLDETLEFFCGKLGLVEVERRAFPEGKFTIVFLAAPEDVERFRSDWAPAVELTWNWDEGGYEAGRNFGHLAFEVDDIYAACQKLIDGGVAINRPPHDGRMAFVRSPDNISVELLQKGDPLERREPWASMKNTGTW